MTDFTWNAFECRGCLFQVWIFFLKWFFIIQIGIPRGKWYGLINKKYYNVTYKNSKGDEKEIYFRGQDPHLLTIRACIKITIDFRK